MKTIEKSLVLSIVFSVLYNIVNFSVSCENINSKVFRLHILANSDSNEDQNLKLRIKSEIQELSKKLLSSNYNKEKSEDVFIKNLSNVEKIVKNEIRNCGYDYPVFTKVTNSYFTTRNYENFTLPAGNYDALEIKIGSGEGKNWWCVIFPMLCVGASSKNKILDKTFNKNEKNIICNNKKKYAIKFRIVEIYQLVKKWIYSKIYKL